MKSLVRKLIYSNNFFYRLYFDLSDLTNQSTLDKELLKLFKKIKIENFIQIGANDGFSNDPIYKFIRRYKLSGIFVEPQKHLIRELEHLHNHLGINVVNGAIGLKNSSQKIYHLNISESRWANGLTSFEEKVLLGSLKSDFVQENARRENVNLNLGELNKYISSYEIKTHTFSEILTKYNYDKIDLVCIDVEGFESTLIPNIDLSKHGVKVFIHEHRHLTEQEELRVNKHLKAHGFVSIRCEFDTLSYRI